MYSEGAEMLFKALWEEQDLIEQGIGSQGVLLCPRGVRFTGGIDHMGAGSLAFRAQLSLALVSRVP